MNIAIFDSGIGGLSVLYQAKRMLPEAHFLYYADEDHVTYGEKTREQILTYTDEAVRFLIDRGADAIVLACNTATSAAAATLRDRYPLPIIGMEPAVKLALNQDDTHRVLVAAAPITIRGNKLRCLVAAASAWTGALCRKRHLLRRPGTRLFKRATGRIQLGRLRRLCAGMHPF